VQCIVERLHDDARTLGRAVMVAIAVGAPLERKGGGTHGGVMVLVATVSAVIKSFKGTPKVWSGYWSSPAFRRRSSDIKGQMGCILMVTKGMMWWPIETHSSINGQQITNCVSIFGTIETLVQVIQHSHILLIHLFHSSLSHITSQYSIKLIRGRPTGGIKTVG
jgi:hypothetical protein